MVSGALAVIWSYAERCRAGITHRSSVYWAARWRVSVAWPPFTVCGLADGQVSSLLSGMSGVWTVGVVGVQQECSVPADIARSFHAGTQQHTSIDRLTSPIQLTSHDSVDCSTHTAPEDHTPRIRCSCSAR